MCNIEYKNYITFIKSVKNVSDILKNMEGQEESLQKSNWRKLSPTTN